MLNMLIAPVLASQGIDYNPINVGARRRRRKPTDSELKAKEAAKLQAMSASPFRFKTVKTSVDDNEASG